MKVKELIEALKELDQEAEVLTTEGEDGGLHEVDAARLYPSIEGSVVVLSGSNFYHDIQNAIENIF